MGAMSERNETERDGLSSHPTGEAFPWENNDMRSRSAYCICFSVSGSGGSTPAASTSKAQVTPGLFSLRWMRSLSQVPE